MLGLLLDGKRELERAISWQGLEMGIEIRQKEKEVPKAEQDLKVLKEAFGDKLVVLN